MVVFDKRQVEETGGETGGEAGGQRGEDEMHECECDGECEQAGYASSTHSRSSQPQPLGEMV